MFHKKFIKSKDTSGEKWGFGALIWVFSILSSVVTSNAMAAFDLSQVSTSRIIVKYKTPSANRFVSARNAISLNDISMAGEHLTLLRHMSNGAQVVSFGDKKNLKDAQKIVDQLAANPDVEYAELDVLMVPASIPVDPRYAEQWHLYEAQGGLNVEDAWDYGRGEGVVVAVLDTGYRPHGDLVDNLLPGYDFISEHAIGNDGDGRDVDALDTGDGTEDDECGEGQAGRNSSWHGTHIAGILVASANNGVGLTGVAPDAKVIPVRVLGKCGGYTSDIVDAIYWSAGLPLEGIPNNQNPADVINLSLSSSEPAVCSQSYADAVAAARSAGTLVVVAAGNNHSDANKYAPANCPGTFVVGASNRKGERSYYSNFGSEVDVTAPGGEQFVVGGSDGILSLSNDGEINPGSDDYDYLQGTSMAVPHVSGVAALLFSAKSDATLDDVESALIYSARSFAGGCKGCGSGIVDATAAMQLIMGDKRLVERANLTVVLKGRNGKLIKESKASKIGTIRYLATVTNNGLDTAKNIVLESTFTSAVMTINTESDEFVCNAEGTVCELSELGVNESVGVTFEVSTKTNKKLLFNAIVSSDTFDSDLFDNKAVKMFGGSLGWGVFIMLGILLRRKKQVVATGASESKSANDYIR